MKTGKRGPEIFSSAWTCTILSSLKSMTRRERDSFTAHTWTIGKGRQKTNTKSATSRTRIDRTSDTRKVKKNESGKWPRNFKTQWAAREHPVVTGLTNRNTCRLCASLHDGGLPLRKAALVAVHPLQEMGFFGLSFPFATFGRFYAVRYPPPPSPSLSLSFLLKDGRSAKALQTLRRFLVAPYYYYFVSVRVFGVASVSLGQRRRNALMCRPPWGVGRRG